MFCTNDIGATPHRPTRSTPVVVPPTSHPTRVITAAAQANPIQAAISVAQATSAPQRSRTLEMAGSPGKKAMLLCQDPAGGRWYLPAAMRRYHWPSHFMRSSGRCAPCVSRVTITAKRCTRPTGIGRPLQPGQRATKTP